jgi:hypothetical protein
MDESNAKGIYLEKTNLRCDELLPFACGRGLNRHGIPISVVSELIHQDGTDLEQAIGELATIGIFFAMRSCEYLKVEKPDQRRTEILRLRNVRFFRGVEQLSHDYK